MAGNPYHDGEGRFCSKGEMRTAIIKLYKQGRDGEAFDLGLELHNIENSKKASLSSESIPDSGFNTSVSSPKPNIVFDPNHIPSAEFKIDSYKTKKWLLNGLLHRENGPAVEYADGGKMWYVAGSLHRENGPAIEYPDGYKAWYQNGHLLREDGPVIEEPNSYRAWMVDGNIVREERSEKS